MHELSASLRNERILPRIQLARSYIIIFGSLGPAILIELFDAALSKLEADVGFHHECREVREHCPEATAC